ncbi:hypothetical protein NL676_013000 [Syzygium grande]|nr:hypothetical protein NL676_013000 [Syzygium grande]
MGRAVRKDDGSVVGRSRAWPIGNISKGIISSEDPDGGDSREKLRRHGPDQVETTPVPRHVYGDPSPAAPNRRADNAGNFWRIRTGAPRVEAPAVV